MKAQRYRLVLPSRRGDRPPRAARPGLVIALLWIGLTACIPMVLSEAAEPADGVTALVAAGSVEAGAEIVAQSSTARLAAWSEALLWPFGLAPSNNIALSLGRSLQLRGSLGTGLCE